MSTMCPSPLAISAGNSAFVTRTTPSTLTSYIHCQSSMLASAIGSTPSAPPALFTSTRQPGTASASAATDSSSRTSRATAWPSISFASASSRSTRRAAQTTSKPSVASLRAVASPIPLLAPVTTATGRLIHCLSGLHGLFPWLLGGDSVGVRAGWLIRSDHQHVRGGAVAAANVVRLPGVGRPLPRRVATISVHTSPLDQPGSGDAGGMNVYVVEIARRLAARGTEVEIFTRATSGDLPPSVELLPGVTVRHIAAGPFEGLHKEDLPSQLCAFTSGVLRAEATRDPGYYDLIHSHYWLSGHVGWLAKERWGVPLVHTAHTLAKVKNAWLAAGDRPEPTGRAVGEAQVVAAADRLIASTADEADQLVQLYDADPSHISVVAPGVDLDTFRPGDRLAARARLGVDPGATVLLFVGRIQPLKAPDVVLRAAALMVQADLS